MEFAGCSNDNAFGPSVQGCRGDFDFTIKFEKIFFSLIPSSIIIAVAAPRLIALIRRHPIVAGAWFQLIKVAFILALAAIQLSLIALSAKSKILKDLFLAASALDFVATLCVATVSFFEHSRSPRPSILLNSYLFLLVLFDIAQVRSLWLVAGSESDFLFVRLFTSALALRVLILVLESKRKLRWLKWEDKDHSPEETSGIYSLATFWWLKSLLNTGYKKVLDPADLFALDHELSSHALKQYVDHIDAKTFRGKRNGLAKTIAKSLAVPILLPVAPRLAFIAFSLCQPLLIESLLDYLKQPEGRSPNTGYGLIGATILIYFGLPLSQSIFTYFLQRSIFSVRGVLVSAIYNQTTESSIVASDDAAALTLMSTDVERIRMGLTVLHECWAIPVQVGISCWLLYRQIGAAFVAPMVVIIVCVGATAFLVRLVGPLQAAWMGLVQKRVGKTSNAIANMKNIKISGLKQPVEEAIQDMRVHEIKAGNKFRRIELIITGLGFTPGQTSAMFTLAVTTRSLDVSTIFSSVAYLTLLASPLNGLIQSAPEIVAALACVQRIQDFLDKEPRHDFRTFTTSAEGINGSSDNGRPVAIKITEGNFGWTSDKLCLKDISATITGGLNMIVGPVASGKSSFCKVLLGEIPFAKGEVLVNATATKIGFCDQVPFLFNASIQQNIVGFAPFDERRYQESLEGSMLNPDLILLPLGDQTKIGSNGIALSGGQKQRVAIARALYQDCEMLIFDDILSGLDADTEQQVFTRVFGPEGILKQRGATAVLCTHSVRHLPDADHILALSTEGKVVEQGNFSDLMSNKKYVYGLGIKDKELGPNSTSATSASDSEDKVSVETPIAKPTKRPDLAAQEKEKIARTMGDASVFLHYFRSIGVFWLTLFFGSGVIDGFLWNFPNVWLKYWAEDLGPDAHHSTAFYIGIYAFLCIACVIFVVVEIGIGFLAITKISGIVLHRNAVRTLCAAPLRFFTTTDVGVVTNLFSQDMTMIDGELPGSFLNAAAMFWIVIGGAAVSATASPYVIISYPFLVVVVYYLQKFYLRTSRQLRLLDLETKSPLYTNFIDTIKGVVTFRAFGWTDAAIAQNNQFLDKSQTPAYLLALVQRWLNSILAMLIAIIAILVVTLSTQLQSNSGFAGASMVSIISFGGFLAAFVQNYTMLEVSLGAVNRLKTFDDKTAAEDLNGEDVVPPQSWPEKGRLELRNVSASYDDSKSVEATDNEKQEQDAEQRLALDDLTLTIEAGQKVALCGRTGSGKSSTVLLLLRLLDPIPGSNYTLSIDGQPLDKVNRSVLRQRVIAVPQEPVFLPDGTSFLTNLDPTHNATTEECQGALEAVDLWNFVMEKGGLKMALNADELSQGQKQLFSLGRAILRRRMRARLLAGEVGEVYLTGVSEKSAMNEVSTVTANSTNTVDGGLLILDEYSSSLDIETDRTMQAIVRKEFVGYTIVMVSHRLEMVMGFDKVIVLDAGKVIEEGVPAELAQQEGSRFHELCMIDRND